MAISIGKSIFNKNFIHIYFLTDVLFAMNRLWVGSELWLLHDIT